MPTSERRNEREEAAKFQESGSGLVQYLRSKTRLEVEVEGRADVLVGVLMVKLVLLSVALMVARRWCRLSGRKEDRFIERM